MADTEHEQLQDKARAKTLRYWRKLYEPWYAKGYPRERYQQFEDRMLHEWFGDPLLEDSVLRRERVLTMAKEEPGRARRQR